MNRYYFTFGSAEYFPFKYGYVIIEAPNRSIACKVFRSHFPDAHEGYLNCSFVYDKGEFSKTGMVNNKCHKVIKFADNVD